MALNAISPNRKTTRTNFSQGSLRGVEPFELVRTAATEPDKLEKLKKLISKATSTVAEKFFFDKDEEQLTPLGLALKIDALDVVDVFLDALPQFPNIDINYQDGQGYSLLHSAVSFSSERGLKKLLAIPSLQADLVNSAKNSPLHYFCEKYTGTNPTVILKLLIQKGKDNKFSPSSKKE